MKKCIGKLNNGKGFTLLEMLIVVAIIGIMVAMSIPFATDQLEQSREAADLAEIRGAYTKLMISAMTYMPEDDVQYDESSGMYFIEIPKLQQKLKGWDISKSSVVIGGIYSTDGKPHWDGNPVDGKNSCTLYYSEATGTVIKWGIGISPKEALLQRIEPIFVGDSFTSVATSFGGYIVSNKPSEITALLRDQGITNAQVFINNANPTNDVGIYANKVLSSNGVSGASYVKIVSVSTDGKVLSDMKVGDKVDVIQYLYYQSQEKINNGKRVVLFGTRQTTATVRKITDRDTFSFDMSDLNGDSWTKH